MNTDLNTLRDRAYKCACEHGFHEEKLSNEHFLCLVISELMEAVEADRKEKRANVTSFKKMKEHYSKDRYKEMSEEKRSREFQRFFEFYIKDTIEDELADAVIRLLDLSGLRKIDMNDRFIIAYVVTKKKSFTENCYAILKDIVNYRYSLEECLNYAIRQVFELASFYDIDLTWHIEQKMKYNELRPNKHGKKY